MHSLRLVEEIAHTAGADADEHLDELTGDAKKGLASPATARERSVFPVPGGPTNRTPRGIRAPRAANFSGYLRNSTTSTSSSLASSTPATSEKTTEAGSR